MLAASWQATKWLYRVSILVLVLTALYLTVVLWLVPQVDRLAPRLEQYLSGRLNMPVAISAIEARVEGFTPVVEIRGLQAGLGILVDRAVIKPDLMSVVTSGKFAMQKMQLSGVWLQLSEIDNGYRIPGANPVPANTAGIGLNNRRVLDLLYSLGAVDFDGLTLVVSPSFAGEFVFSVPKVSIAAVGDERFVSADLQIGDAEHTATAEFRLNMERGVLASSAKGYLSVDEVVLNELGDLLPAAELIPGDISLGGEFWFAIRNDRLLNWQASVRLPKLNWSHTQTGPISADNTSANLHWQRQPSGWSLMVNPRSESLTLPQWATIEQSNGRFNIRSDDLDLTSAAVLVDRLLAVELVRNLAPSGMLSQPQLTIEPNGDWQLAGQLAQVAVTSTNGIPGGRGLTGQLWTNGQVGVVDLQAGESELDINNVFANAWDAQRMVGKIGFWRHEGVLNIRSPRLQIEQIDKQLLGSFNARIAINSPREPRLSLAVQSSGASKADLASFVPTLDNLSGVRSWLLQRVQSLTAGAGEFAMSIPLDDQHLDHRHQFWLDFPITQAQVNYLDDWPLAANANGRLQVNQDRTLVTIEQTQWGALQNLSGSVQINHRTSMLDINASTSQTLAAMYDAMLASPLRQNMGSELASWQLAGDGELAVNIALALQQANDVAVEASLTTNNGNLAMPNSRLAIEQIAGQLNFDLQTGLSGELTAQLFGGQVSAQLLPVFEQQQVVNIAATGNAELDAVSQWLAVPLLDEVTGKTAFDGQLLVDRQGIALTLQSDLLGARLDWPEPMKKDSQDIWPLQLQYSNRFGEGNNITATITDKAKAQIYFAQDQLNGAIAYGQSLPTQLPESGIAILASTDQVDAQQWWQWATDRFVGSTTPAMNNPISEIVIRANAASFNDININQPRLILRHADSRWTADLRSQEIVGLIGISDNPDDPLQVALSLLNIQSNERDGDSQVDPLADFDPSSLPAMDIEIQRLAIDDQDMGSWRGTMRPTDNGVQFKQISGVMRGIEVSGSADWLKRDGRLQTQARVRLRTTSLADVLENFAQPRVLDSSSALMNIDFAWQGSPLALSFSQVSGELDFDLLGGTIYQVENLEGLKLFGLLNMTRVLNRLALDFSDIVGPGLTYDQITGDIVFANGYASVGDNLSFDSSSVFITFDGGVNLLTEQLDADAQVSIPITSAIPVAVFLAGVSPQVAGLLFVTERIMNEQLIRRAWIRYLLSGSLNDIQFQVYPARVGDN